MKKTLKDYDFLGKKVLLRADLNVPMDGAKITGDARIVAELPTIKYLLDAGARVILCSHLGRPNGEVNKKYSLKPVFERLQVLLTEVKMYFCNQTVGEKSIKMANELKNGELLLLENLRFEKGEEENSEEMVNALSSLADIFVLDAFGTCHRKHASTYGVSQKLPSAVGLLVEKELEMFNEILKEPKHPFVAILGGAKVSDKLSVIENLFSKVDTILIGGGMCFTFIKAIKGEVGASLVDNEKIDFCYNIIKEAINRKLKIILPIDFVCANSIDDESGAEIYKIDKIPNDKMGLDIGPKTIRLFNKYIKKARTIVWNGPMGVYEKEMFKNGTKSVAELITKNKRVISVIGGGDVVSAVEEFDLADKFTHVSTGGGASLKLLEGKSLVAIDAISDK